MNIFIIPDRFAFYRLSIFQKISLLFDRFGHTTYILYDSSQPTQRNIPIVQPSVLSSTSLIPLQISDIQFHQITIFQLGVIKYFFCLSPSLIVAWGDSFRISTWLLLLLSRLRGSKVVLWSHGLYGTEATLLLFFRLAFYRLANHLFVYGKYSSNLLTRYLPDKPLTVVGNSLSSYPTAPPTSYTIPDLHTPIKLLFVGRLNAKKGFTEFFQLLGSYMRPFPFNFSLTLVGDGPLKSRLLDLVSCLDLCHIIKFSDPVYDEPSLSKLFSSHHVYFQPQNLGLGGFTSFFYGKPIITSADPRLQMPEFDYCNPYNSCLFDSADINSFFFALRSTITLYNSSSSLPLDIHQYALNYCTPDAQFNNLNHTLQSFVR